MIWVIAEDQDLYHTKNEKRLLEKYKKTHIVKFPTEDIFNNYDLNELSNTLFLAPYKPPVQFIGFIPQAIEFGDSGILTSQEKALSVTAPQALARRLGIEIADSTYTLDDVAGAIKLKEWTRDYLKAREQGYKCKAIFLAGLPGTGKTYFAKAFAGSTERRLVYLNLSALMSKDEPIDELLKIHTFLANIPDTKYVILLDEVEKMIGNGTAAEKQMLGAVLTLMNESDARDSQFRDLDVMYIATANNLSTILKENPELLRRGRFDELFFINLPTFEEARDLLEFYAKRYGNTQGLTELLGNTENLLIMIDDRWGAERIHNSRFVYSPAEIDTLHKLINFKQKTKDQLSTEDIEEVIELVIPLVKSAKNGLTNMLSQAELFTQI